MLVVRWTRKKERPPPVYRAVDMSDASDPWKVIDDSEYAHVSHESLSQKGPYKTYCIPVTEGKNVTCNTLLCGNADEERLSEDNDIFKNSTFSTFF